MRTLAAKGFRLMEKSGVAKAAAIAVPMVLIECHSSPPQVPMDRVTVVDIGAAGPAAAVDEAYAGSSGAGAKSGNRRAALKTELNVDIYENCLLIARLSVINPDGSLNRIILDPKVDFILEGAGVGSFATVCTQAWECDVSTVAMSSSKNHIQAGIKATFSPAGDSGLSASSARIPLAGEDFHQNCP